MNTKPRPDWYSPRLKPVVCTPYRLAKLKRVARAAATKNGHRMPRHWRPIWQPKGSVSPPDQWFLTCLNPSCPCGAWIETRDGGHASGTALTDPCYNPTKGETP
jgi:hypothetical protein